MSLDSPQSRSHLQAALYVSERLANLGATFLSGVLVLRCLGPSAFAVYGMTISVALACSMFARLALDERFAYAYVSGRASPVLAKALIAQRAVVGVGLGLYVALAFGSELSILGPWTTIAIGLFCFIEAFSVAEIEVQAMSRFRVLSVLGIARSVTGLLLRAALFLLGRGSVEALLSVALLELAVFRFGLQWSHNRIRPAWLGGSWRGGMRELRVFFAPQRLRGYLLASVLSIAYTRTEMFFAAAGLEKNSLGTYLAAQRFVEVYAYLGNVLGSLLLGRIAALRDDETKRFMVSTTLRLGGIAALLTILNVTTLSALLAHVVGRNYPDLPNTFAVLSLNVIPLYVGMPIGKVLMSRGRTRLMIVGGFLAVLVSVATFLILLPPSLGSLRPALSIVIGNACGCAVVVAGALLAPNHPIDKLARPDVAKFGSPME